MPRSPKKTAKTQSKTKSKSKEASTKSRIVPTAPFSDVSNLPPPPTSRVIDFALSLPEPENRNNQDGWSSDDSFEEKITWSRHRVRTIPGGCTPRNIQDVRRRLNLAELPEDNNASPTIVRPIPVKRRKQSSRPSTPVKTFLGKDTSVLPPTPSPKKTASATVRPSTPAGGRAVAKTPAKPAKPAKEISRPMILAAQGGSGILRPASPLRPPTPLRPASPFRQPITQVKEFHFASDARARRKTNSKVDGPEREWNSKTMELGRMEGVEMDGIGDVVDEGLATRMKAHEIGMASILAWGETRGRYLDH